MKNLVSLLNIMPLQGGTHYTGSWHDHDTSWGAVLNFGADRSSCSSYEKVRPGTQEKVVYNALRIDPDPKRSGCSKKLSLEGNVLVADFTANQAKHLRVGINSFFDLLLLAIKTVEHFGHPSS
ncbi:hypothetical protein HPB48_005639 [Haemaphysalis longicornis]|uniref:Uncharacterized protein n=1 Tax=Haemaphysalis longicornis TaxID=44386 RepID=A0A9J6G8Y3_HAELO|nr:hypothetical protein HPB48_005639 [Haemaphysalis longicornis]